MGIRYQIETVTPGRASAMLQKVVKEPQNIDDVAVSSYAAAMKAGGWVMNGMPIIFDEKDRVLDGVHRLKACIAADTPFRTLVARGVRGDTLHTIDQHRRRSYDQVLLARGLKEPGAAFRVLSKIIRIENGILGKGNPPISWSIYDAVLDAPVDVKWSEWDEDEEKIRKFQINRMSDGVEHAILIARSFTLNGRKLASVHHTARPVFVLMAMLSGHIEKAKDFLKDVGDREMYLLEREGHAGSTNAASQLADRTHTLHQEGIEIGGDESLGRAIQYFSYYIKGVTLPSTQAPYKRDYGAARPTKGDAPLLRKVIDLAPPNLGLPKMPGYRGIPQAVFGQKSSAFTGQTAESLVEAAIPSPDSGKNIVRTMSIDANTAEDWLAKYNNDNRTPHKTQVSNIARDIVSGRWLTNAQPICFAGDPFSGKDARLLNGQHRLMALMEAQQRTTEGKLNIEVSVVVDIPEAAFSTYDNHARRAVESFQLERTDPRVLLSAAGIIWRTYSEQEIRPKLVANLLKPRTSDPAAALDLIINPVSFSKIFNVPGMPSMSEKNEIVERHKELLATCYRRARRKGLVDIAPLGVLTAFMMMILDRTEPRTAAEEFLDILEEEKDYTRGDPLFRVEPITKDGELILTKALLVEKNKSASSRRGILSELIRSWEAYAEFRSKPEMVVKTNLQWPARDLEDLDLNAHLNRRQIDMLKSEMSKSSIHKTASKDTCPDSDDWEQKRLI